MRRYSSIVVSCLVCGLLLALQNLSSWGDPITITSAATGYTGVKGPMFPDLGRAFAPTGEKPQSKLWYNDGRWWASMLHTDGKYYIFYLQGQSWVKTSTMLDDRTATQADCLWDGVANKLYAASGGGPNSTGVEHEARLYRYSYNPILKTYTSDFSPAPVIRPGGAETIVIDKDSTGQLWTTYTQYGKVWINHSTSADNVWGTPFNPPMPSSLASGINVGSDDISALVAFDGKIAVIWSNQNDSTFYYAIHDDDDPDESRWTSGIALRQPDIADDHINLKSVQSDAGGNLFAVVKTSISTNGSSDPRIVVLRRDPAGRWSYAVFVYQMEGGVQMHHTRPTLLIDSVNHRLYVFATLTTDGGTIVYKQSSNYTAGPLSFPSGPGTNFIKIDGLSALNNATTTKQNVNGATDLVVLASDAAYRFYAHNILDLPGAGPTATPTGTSIVIPTITPTPSATPRPGSDTHVYLPLLRR